MEATSVLNCNSGHADHKKKRRNIRKTIKSLKTKVSELIRSYVFRIGASVNSDKKTEAILAIIDPNEKINLDPETLTSVTAKIKHLKRTDLIKIDAIINRKESEISEVSSFDPAVQQIHQIEQRPIEQSNKEKNSFAKQSITKSIAKQIASPIRKNFKKAITKSIAQQRARNKASTELWHDYNKLMAAMDMKPSGRPLKLTNLDKDNTLGLN